MGKKIEEMTLLELEGLTAEAAAAKGFSLGTVSDVSEIRTAILPIAAVHARLMQTLEGHRKGNGLLFADPALREAARNAEDDFKAEGFFDKLSDEKVYLIAKLLLISSEAAEAIEAVLEMGTDNPKTSQALVVEEIADIVIRSLGLNNELLAAYPSLGGKLSVATATGEKIVYNAGRPHKHGNKKY